MSIKKYARWATFAAALSMPIAALAQDQATPSQQQQPAQTQPVPSQQQPGATGQQQPMQGENAPSTPEEGTQGTQGMQGQQGQQGQAKLSKSEIDTLAFLKQVNEDEIKAGKMAQSQGSSTGVKDLGKTIVQDHENLNKQISQFAKQNNIKLPSKSKLPTEDQSQLRMLTQQSTEMKRQKGTQFDQMFLQNTVKDHQQVLARIDTAASQTQNPELQSLLNDKVKPVLQAHQDRANELLKSNAQAMK